MLMWTYFCSRCNVFFFNAQNNLLVVACGLIGDWQILGILTEGTEQLSLRATRSTLHFCSRLSRQTESSDPVDTPRWPCMMRSILTSVCYLYGHKNLTMHIPFSLNTTLSVPFLLLSPTLSPPLALFFLLLPALSSQVFLWAQCPAPVVVTTASDAHTPVVQRDWPRRLDYRSSFVIGLRGRDVQSGTASSLTAPQAAASCAPNEPVSSQFGGGRAEGKREKEREEKNAKSKWSRGRERDGASVVV